MKTWLFTVSLGAAMLSSGAGAQGRGGSMQQDMTRAQAQQMADSMFERFDLNHDGTVTRAEAAQAGAQFGERAQRMIDRVFRNAEALTLAQFEAQQLARFDRDDLNHDGTVTTAERAQVRAQLKAERGQNPGQ